MGLHNRFVILSLPKDLVVAEKAEILRQAQDDSTSRFWLTHFRDTALEAVLCARKRAAVHFITVGLKGLLHEHADLGVALGERRRHF